MIITEGLMNQKMLKSTANENKWKCNTCFVQNSSDLVNCYVCESPKFHTDSTDFYNTLPLNTLFGKKIQPINVSDVKDSKSKYWTCINCFHSNDLNEDICVKCQQIKGGSNKFPNKLSGAVSPGFFRQINSDNGSEKQGKPKFQSGFLSLNTSETERDSIDSSKNKYNSNEENFFSTKTLESSPIPTKYNSKTYNESPVYKLNNAYIEGMGTPKKSNSRSRDLNSIEQSHSDEDHQAYQHGKTYVTSNGGDSRSDLMNSIHKRSIDYFNSLFNSKNSNDISPDNFKRHRVSISSPLATPFVRSYMRKKNNLCDSPVDKPNNVNSSIADCLNDSLNISSNYNFAIDELYKRKNLGTLLTPHNSSDDHLENGKKNQEHPQMKDQNETTLPDNLDSNSSLCKAYRFSFGATQEKDDLFQFQFFDNLPFNQNADETGCTPNTYTPQVATPNFGSSESSFNNVPIPIVRKMGKQSSSKNVEDSANELDLHTQDVTKNKPTDEPPIDNCNDPTPIPGLNIETNDNETNKDIKINIRVTSSNEMPYGVVYTWGTGECDQLAVAEQHLNDFGSCPIPHCIVKLRKQQVYQVSCGSLHSVALLYDGSIVTWGCNDDGALGRDKTTVERIPARVTLPSDTDDRVISISAGDNHSAYITHKGHCYIWGSYRDSFGSIGFPDSESLEKSHKKKSYDPFKVSNLKGKCIRLCSGENHTAVLCYNEDLNQTYVQVWGSNEFGQLAQPCEADPSKNKKLELLYPQSLTHTEWTNNDIISNIFCGNNTTFFEIRQLTTGGTRYYGVGRNSSGELGIGYTQNIVDSPQLLKNFNEIELTTITSTQFVSLALTNDNSIYSWGSSDFIGQGECDYVNQSFPTKIPFFQDKLVTDIGKGSDTCFAIVHPGILYAWGDGQMYQIGDGNEYSQTVKYPKLIDTAYFEQNPVLAVSGGSHHSIALVYKGDLKHEKYFFPECLQSLIPFDLKKTFGMILFAFIQQFNTQTNKNRKIQIQTTYPHDLQSIDLSQATLDSIDFKPKRSKRSYKLSSRIDLIVSPDATRTSRAKKPVDQLDLFIQNKELEITTQKNNKKLKLSQQNEHQTPHFLSNTKISTDSRNNNHVHNNLTTIERKNLISGPVEEIKDNLTMKSVSSINNKNNKMETKPVKIESESINRKNTKKSVPSEAELKLNVTSRTKRITASKDGVKSDTTSKKRKSNNSVVEVKSESIVKSVKVGNSKVVVKADTSGKVSKGKGSKVVDKVPVKEESKTVKMSKSPKKDGAVDKKKKTDNSKVEAKKDAKEKTKSDKSQMKIGAVSKTEKSKSSKAQLKLDSKEKTTKNKLSTSQSKSKTPDKTDKSKTPDKTDKSKTPDKTDKSKTSKVVSKIDTSNKVVQSKASKASPKVESKQAKNTPSKSSVKVNATPDISKPQNVRTTSKSKTTTNQTNTQSKSTSSKMVSTKKVTPTKSKEKSIENKVVENQQASDKSEKKNKK